MWALLYGLSDQVLGLPGTIYFCIVSCVTLLFCSLWSSRTRSCERPSPGDWALVLFVSLQLAGIFTGTVPGNTEHFLIASISALCWYRIVRTVRLTEGILVGIVRTFSAIGCLDAISNLLLDFQSFEMLRIFPNSSLESLHALIMFVGGPTRNDALLLLLLLLPFAVAAWIAEEHLNTRLVWPARLSVALITSTLIMSLSRSIYIACFVFIAVVLILWSKTKPFHPVSINTGLMTIIAVCTVAVGIFNVIGAILRSLLIFHSVSQQRSAVGRFVLWGTRLNLVRVHPLFGWGWSSDGIVSLASIQHTSEAAFTARAYNTPLELLISGGIFGFITYTFFLVYALWSSRPSKLNRVPSFIFRFVSVVLGAGLIAALVRDMTYSSLVLHGTSVFISFLICALIQSSNTCGLSTASNKRISTLACEFLNISSVILGITVVCFYVSLSGIESSYRTGLTLLQQSHISRAVDYLSKAANGPWKSAAFYSAEGLANIRLALQDSKPLSTSPLVAVKDSRRPYLIAAKHSYELAIIYSPYDANLLVNIGWIDALLLHDDAAKYEFTQAIHADPYDFFAHLSLALLYERAANNQLATKEYQRALTLSPRLAMSPFWFNLRRRFPEMADEVIGGSIADLQKELPSPIAEARIAVLYEARGDFGMAQRNYRGATNALPNLSYPWFGLAKGDIARGDTESALINLKKSLLIYPGNISAKLELAHLLREKGETVLAVSLYRQALYTPPHSVHFERFERIYNIQPLEPDDVFPPGLLESTEPTFVSEAICDESLFSGTSSYANQDFVQRRYGLQISRCEGKLQ